MNKDGPETGPRSLDDALKAFSTAKPSLTDALRDFAATTQQAPKKPPPWAPVRPPPEAKTEPPKPEKPVSDRPHIDPVTHMRTAISYLEDAEKRFERASHLTGDDAFLEVIQITVILHNAALELDDARRQNPDATITLSDRTGEPYEATIDILSARVLAREGRYCFYAACQLDEQVEQQGYKTLKDAEEAYRGALKYQPYHPDYHLALAQVLKALGEKDSAIASVKEALRIDPSFVAAVKLLNELELKEVTPLYRNKPPPKEPIRWRPLLIGGSLVGFFLVTPIMTSAGHPGIAGLIGLVSMGTFAFTLYNIWDDWRFRRAFKKDYEDSKIGMDHLKSEEQTKKLQARVFLQRYNEDKKAEKR